MKSGKKNSVKIQGSDAALSRLHFAMEVIESLRKCRALEKRFITKLFEELATNPFRTGDYVETDKIGRPIQVVVVGRHAVCFWADHPVKEVKVIDLKSAGT